MHVTFQGTKEPVRSGRAKRTSWSAGATVFPWVSFLPVQVRRKGLLTIWRYINTVRTPRTTEECAMVTIDEKSKIFFKDKIDQDKVLRVFFGGYG